MQLLCRIPKPSPSLARFKLLCSCETVADTDNERRLAQAWNRSVSQTKGDSVLYKINVIAKVLHFVLHIITKLST
jgi:hypothetical protein